MGTSGDSLTREELLALAENFRLHGWELLDRARRVREERFGRAVRLCSIVPGKLGGCGGDCRWCAQSRYVAAGGKDETKRTLREEIVRQACRAVEWGSANIGIVNSGLRPTDRDVEEIVQAAEAIQKATGGKIEVCASLGHLTEKQARRLADSPIVRYHHNLETSRRFFPSVVTSHAYEEKIQTLQRAKSAGLAVCCGGLFGLGESWEDRIDLAILLRDEIQPDVVPLNFLVPIPQTPLAGQNPLPPLEILTIIAIFRLILPLVDIKIAGGRETNLRSMQSWIFFSGATSMMIGNYLTTAGQDPQEDLKMLKDLELEIVHKFT